MNRQNIIWWGTAFFWTGVATVLWVRAYRVGKRDAEGRKEIIEDQKIALMIADYLTEKERSNWCDCANEPDYTFLLRRSFELQQEKIDNNRPLAS